MGTEGGQVNKTRQSHELSRFALAGVWLGVDAIPTAWKDALAKDPPLGELIGRFVAATAIARQDSTATAFGGKRLAGSAVSSVSILRVVAVSRTTVPVLRRPSARNCACSGSNFNVRRILGAHNYTQRSSG